MQTPLPPKGTRDFYPDEIALREKIFSSWHATCRRYGFELFDAPMFEHLEVYTQKSGQEIEKQLYTFQDKGGRDLALRPELTPSLARMVAAKGSALKKPVRWYSIPRLFRYEKMQKGRLREFFQLNMDILGVAGMNADAELIAAVAAMMTDLGCGADDFSIHVSSRNLLEELFISIGVPEESLLNLYGVLDKKHKISADAFTADLHTVLPDSATVGNVNTILEAQTLEDIGTINNSLQSYEQLSQLFSLFKLYGITDLVNFDVGIVRGLAYYTGTVFEVFDKKRSMRAIAGGGRYDKLVKLYGGPDTPAVGFAAGDVVLADLLREKGDDIPLPPRSDIFIVAFPDAFPEYAIGVCQKVRNHGFSAELPLKQVGVGKQMKLANAARAKVVLFVGGEEKEQGKMKLKNMISGDELVFEENCLLERLGEHLTVNER